MAANRVIPPAHASHGEDDCPWQFGADLLVGSAVVGGVLGGIGGLATYLTLRGGSKDPLFDTLARRASDRYVGTSITAWEFARGKLRGDPLYREVLIRGWLPSGGRLLDIGCGQGLMLALLAEAGRVARDGPGPAGARLPRFERMVGIELRAHRARLARAALGPDADIIESDARTILPGGCRAVLLFDVLHMMSEGDQEALLSAAVGALGPRRGDPRSGSRCVGRMALRGDPRRQQVDRTGIGRLAAASGLSDGGRVA